MAEICCGIVSDGEGSAPGESSSRAARRRRMEIRRFKYVAGVLPPPEAAFGREQKRPKGTARDCENAVQNCCLEDDDKSGKSVEKSSASLSAAAAADSVASDGAPKFGFASVCGRRRDMEDALAIMPSFACPQDDAAASELHYYGVYDGHGCSHVATKCRERLHELLKDEVKSKTPSPAEAEWKSAMERSFARMDEEVVACNDGGGGLGATCRCELQSPECDAVGSAAVVAVVSPEKVVVANCGDSRAVLCRNGKPVPLSVDHKPDRPDELSRIQAAGGRVIYWDGPRVLGVLAMSRAIGDNYLKPYVSCEPEVTITDRTEEDDCLILASDGLWDVVTNETACGVARMCLRGKAQPATAAASPDIRAVGVASDKACSDAAMLLTKLALARHSTDNVSVIVVDLRRHRET